jgi:hypothetical protein
MAITTVSDYVIWTKHIHGDPELVARIHALWAGLTIELDVDGVRGIWRKMDDGSDGRETPGIRPLGAAQIAWRSLYRERRGETVTIAEVETHGGVAETAKAAPEKPLISPPMAKTEEERQAALQALLDAWKQGYRSEGPRMTRDEMHER